MGSGGAKLAVSFRISIFLQLTGKYGRCKKWEINEPVRLLCTQPSGSLGSLRPPAHVLVT